MYKIFKSGIAADREGMECPESYQTVLRNPEHTEPGFKLLIQVPRVRLQRVLRPDSPTITREQ